MKITRRTIGKGLMLGTMILMGSGFSANAAPPPPSGCPTGWTPRPQEVNFQLGPCLPGTIATPLPNPHQAQPKPLTCPEGWQTRPQEVNFQLGPCLPGTIVTPTPQPQAELLLPAIQKMHLGLPGR